MNHPAIHFSKQALPLALPLLVVASSVFIILSGLFWQQPEALAFGITYDLVLFSPLLYLYLIRNKRIPKITALSFFIGGFWLATFLLPEAFHSYSSLIQTYLFPLAELALLSFLLYKTSQTIREYKKGKQEADFLTALRSSTEKALGYRKIAHVITSEVAVIYYCLFSWKNNQPIQSRLFSYHRQNGVPALYGAIILLLVVEALAIHFVAAIWSPLLAWILTLGTVYTCLQLFTHLKAMMQRPVEVGHNYLHIRYGIMGDTDIPFGCIDSVEVVKQAPKEKGIHHLALLKMLEPGTVAIRLKKPQVLLGMYGTEKKFTILLLNIDRKEAFEKILQERISGSTEE